MKTTEELKNLLYKNETVADAAPDAIAAAQDFCEGYKTFLDNAKTEREATAYSEKLLTAAGYQKVVPGTSYAPGTKVYTINREKCVLAATIGTKNLSSSSTFTLDLLLHYILNIIGRDDILNLYTSDCYSPTLRIQVDLSFHMF